MTTIETIAPLLDRGVQLRIQAKALEDEAEAMKAQANTLFTTALDASGEEKLIHERGTVTRSVQVRKNLNQNTLTQTLLGKGVQAKVIADSIEESTELKEITSITFREKKSE